MAKCTIDAFDLEDLEQLVRRHDELAHIRLRKRGDTVTLESGPKADPVRHARLRRVTVRDWELEMPTHMGRWQPTFIRAHKEQLLETLVADFGWTLAPIDGA